MNKKKLIEILTDIEIDGGSWHDHDYVAGYTAGVRKCIETVKEFKESKWLVIFTYF